MGVKDYFVSQEFINSLRLLSKKFEQEDFNKLSCIEYIIDVSIRYALSLGEIETISHEKLSEFVKKIASKIDVSISKWPFYRSEKFELNEFANELIVDAILEKLDLNRDSIKDDLYNQLLCGKYIIQKLGGKKYKYHAFNSTFYESILANGINPNINFTPQEEIDEINRIFKKHNVNMIFGWQTLNCKGQVSYSETPSVSYYYASGSPEWFSQFVGQSFAFDSLEKYQKNSFIEGNYEGAKNNLLILMKEKGFSDEELQKVIAFFDKYWKIYADKESMIAMIPEETPNRLEYWAKTLQNDQTYIEEPEELISILSGGDNDRQTDETIDVSNATFIKLPKYYEVIQKLVPKKDDIKTTDLVTKEKTIQSKLDTLKNAKIRVINENGQTKFISDNSEQEAIEVEKILKDYEVYRAILNAETETAASLSGWIKYFDLGIKTIWDNVALLALKKPDLLHYVSYSHLEIIELMRIVANQPGINPIILNYTSLRVNNDFEFVTNLISNSNEKTFNFYIDTGKEDKSCLRYERRIGADVLCNPLFWEMLNLKIISINESSKKQIPLFDIEKELRIANKRRELLLQDKSYVKEIRIA